MNFPDGRFDPRGKVVVSVYSSGAIGRLVPEDVAWLVRYVREHAAAAATPQWIPVTPGRSPISAQMTPWGLTASTVGTLRCWSPALDEAWLIVSVR